MQHRGPQPALLQAPAAVGLRLGDQVPGVLDGAFLEVVTEAEVAAHLEEGAVPGGLADVLDVGRAHALLHAGRPRPRRRLLAQEVGLERHHARVHEQQGRVRHQQRRGGHGLVTGRLEVRDEAAADLGGVHQSFPPCQSVVEERAPASVSKPLARSSSSGGPSSVSPRRSRNSVSFSVMPARTSSANRWAPTDEPGEPVAQALGRERLRGAACLDHDVDADTRSGDEPERPLHRGPCGIVPARAQRAPARSRGIHAAARSSACIRRQASFISRRRCLRARRTSRRISNQIRLRDSGDSARRRPWPKETDLDERLAHGGAEHHAGRARWARASAPPRR